METYVRLMVLKARYRWGYRSLVAEVSDSIHLRRFCRISLGERVPDESTVRKLTRRIGAETVKELTRALIETALREKRFRPRAVRVDSTVIEADVRYPTDAGLASPGVRVLAREGRKLAKLIGEKKRRVQGSVAVGGPQAERVDPHGPAPLGGGEGRGAGVDRADGRAAVERSIKEARKLAAARPAPGGRAWRADEAQGGGGAGGARGSVREGRVARSASGSPASRSRIGWCRFTIRTPGRSARASSASPTNSDCVSQSAEVTEHTKARSARTDRPGLDRAGEPGRGRTAARHLRRARPGSGSGHGRSALDGGFNLGPTTTRRWMTFTPATVFIAGRQEPGCRRTQRRLQRYRTGAEGRISHLKRRYGLDRSRLKGDEGRQIWTGWAILTYNADTLAVRAR